MTQNNVIVTEQKNVRIQNWAILTSEFNCKIGYRPGHGMKADFVSHIRPHTTGNGVDEVTSPDADVSDMWACVDAIDDDDTEDDKKWRRMRRMMNWKIAMMTVRTMK